MPRVSSRDGKLLAQKKVTKHLIWRVKKVEVEQIAGRAARTRGFQRAWP
jgi:hypothetical protein